MAENPTYEKLDQRAETSGKDTSVHERVFGRCLAILLAIIFVICSVNTAEGSESGPTPDAKREVMPADVFLEVQLLGGHLELIRRHMGMPKATPLDISAYKVAPHDVYFQALTLFQKANRISFEITRLQEQPPPRPEDVILPADVLILARGAHEAIRKVMVELNIPESKVKSERDPSKTPSDVFKGILSTNQQLNHLLERRFAPSDVYSEVTLAIGYSARHLARYPGSMRIPDAPPFEAEKKPTDVYFRLLNCLELISRIYEVADLEILHIDVTHIDAKSVTPSDVFDVASLIVARLDFLHKKLDLARMPREAFYPGRKYPSDVYQQAGILMAQLKQIEHLITVKGVPDK